MKKLLLAGGALIAIAALVSASAFAQGAKGKNAGSRSPAARMALCKSDCLPENTHGLYKSYHQTDPKLVGIEGKKQYAECVQKCFMPLPEFYVQKPLFEMGMDWFGKSADSCYDCHTRGTRK